MMSGRANFFADDAGSSRRLAVECASEVDCICLVI
jgi:uncharacterized protein DUF4279